MEINETEIEVRYQETDQMGVVYHANYLIWFEIGRTKYIEQLGFQYAEMEKMEIVSPVVNVQVSYKKPARYGDKIIIQTGLKAYDGIRTTYEYKIKNKQDDILVIGTTDHVVVKKDRFKPVRLRSVFPEWHQAYTNEIKGER